MHKSKLEPTIQLSPAVHEKPAVPYHIAFIMDGNGRWARKQGLPRMVGHESGMRKAREIVELCGNIGVKIVTLYAFSTENWQRPKPEVSFLMRLFETYANREIESLNRNNVRLQYLGRQERLPIRVQRAIERSTRLTSANTGMVLNVALNYGGRAEIVDAARAVIQAINDARLSPNALDELVFDQFLYTAGQPDPDLIIRTGGEWRLSNFLLWQSSNTFFWVTDTYWPDIETADLQTAVEAWNEDCLRSEAAAFNGN